MTGASEGTGDGAAAVPRRDAGERAAAGDGNGDGDAIRPGVEVVSGGRPGREELAAIVAAVEVATARPAAPEPPAPRPARWRFSGRWWSKPVPLRRSRPW